MKSFPIFIKLENSRALVVGGTAAAVSKTRLLLAAGAKVVVIAKKPAAVFYDWAYEGAIELEQRAFAAKDLEGARIVIVATGREIEDRRVAEAAWQRGLPINVVDRPEISSFSVPAIIDRDAVVLAVSTHGAAPVLASDLRGQLETLLPARIGELATFAENHRAAVRRAIPDLGERRRFWEAFFGGPAAGALLAGDRARAEELLQAQLAERNIVKPAKGSVAIVGAGPGDPELLTLRGLRLLKGADVIVYDRLVGPGVIELARREAERIDVGKSAGGKGRSQDEINALLAELAAAGRRVVRLKGGDPFVFGRGGEEVEYLLERGIAVELVPGITAATGCAAVAGFPLTHRQHASAVTFLSGQLRDGEPELDWVGLARTNHTLVFYMGVAAAGTISRRLTENGLDAATPVAIIERGSLPDERIFFGHLSGLGDLIAAEAVRPPALIVIGEVVRLASTAGNLRRSAAARLAATATREEVAA